MFKAICEFFARRRRMREFVAAGRETHEIRAYQPAWVDTMPMQPERRRVRAGTNPPPPYAKPPAPAAPPPVRSERPMSLVAGDPPDSFDTMSALMLANVVAHQQREAQPLDKPISGGGDFGGGGASDSWTSSDSGSSSSTTD